jgi:uncharacterized phage protein (TIGR01671 family)
MRGDIDMREIKFRGWDIDNNKMHHDVCFMASWGFIKFGFHATSWTDSSKAGIGMQYTGLKDNNGKEIYEGDILDERLKLVIEFYMGCFGYWYLENFISICNVTDIICRLKVIGNIYENPKLLENHT